MKQIENLMNIKAPRTDLNQSSPLAGKATDSSSTDSEKTVDASANRDTVTLTNTAATMLKLEESLATVPDIDNNRVATIKASIEEGSYTVDPDKIVNSLLKIERDFF